MNHWHTVDSYVKGHHADLEREAARAARADAARRAGGERPGMLANPVGRLRGVRTGLLASATAQTLRSVVRRGRLLLQD